MPITSTEQIVYWHRELPPLDAEIMEAHTIEASSGHVPGNIAQRDALWNRCYRELMESVHARLAQEIARLGGRYARVFDESIDARRNDALNEAWLHGRFAYMLYRSPKGD